MIGTLLRTAFLYWWEKRVERKLYYYADGKTDATKAFQRHFDHCAFVQPSPGILEVSGTYVLRHPLRMQRTILRGAPEATIKGGIKIAAGSRDCRFQNLRIVDGNPALQGALDEE